MNKMRLCKRKNYFYGWYFRCQCKDGTIGIIPAVHMTEGRWNCSIQIITDRGVWNKIFPICQFRISRGKGIMQIGENLFSRRGIRLRLAADGLKAEGILRFGEFAEPSYDIMGPFRYVPGMECRHAVYSMEHSVRGTLQINEKTICFRDGRGYMEGDSGSSFPEKYVWTQHFFHDGSLMFAAAVIPFMGIKFTGTTGILYHRGQEYRFATYLGARTEKMEEGKLSVTQGPYRLEIRGIQKNGRMLLAPAQGKMSRKVKESISCKAEYVFIYKKQPLLRLRAENAAFECETKEENNENISNHCRKNKRKIFKGRHSRIQ